MTKRDEIIIKSVPLLAKNGFAGTSMRLVADSVGVHASVLYYYFPSKEVLMRELRSYLNQKLDYEFDKTDAGSASALLRKRVELNFRHIESIVALLQYFMAVKADFPVTSSGGVVPDRAYRHMLEIVERGVEEGVYQSTDMLADAKMMAHLVNGHLLEFYPQKLSTAQKKQIAMRVVEFIERALTVRIPA